MQTCLQCHNAAGNIKQQPLVFFWFHSILFIAMLPSPSHYVDLLANVHPIFHHVTLQKHQHRALFLSVTKTLHFQHCQWHKGRTNAAFPQALKFIPNQEQWYCKCEGAFNQWRQSSNTANHLEKKIKKGHHTSFHGFSNSKGFLSHNISRTT